MLLNTFNVLTLMCNSKASMSARSSLAICCVLMSSKAFAARYTYRHKQLRY